jgi:hypothetical protein
MRWRVQSYPITRPRSPREPRPGRGGLSEAEVRAALYPPRRDLVTPLGGRGPRVLTVADFEAFGGSVVALWPLEPWR